MAKCKSHGKPITMFRNDTRAECTLFLCEDCVGEQSHVLYQCEKEVKKLADIKEALAVFHSLCKENSFSFYPLNSQNVQKTQQKIDSIVQIIKSDFAGIAPKRLYYHFKEKYRGPVYEPPRQDSRPVPSPAKRKDTLPERNYGVALATKDEYIQKLQAEIKKLRQQVAGYQKLLQVKDTTIRRQGSATPSKLVCQMVPSTKPPPLLQPRKQEYRQQSFRGLAQLQVRDQRQIEIRVNKSLSLKQYGEMMMRFSGLAKVQELTVLLKDYRFSEEKGRAILEGARQMPSLRRVVVQNAERKTLSGSLFQSMKFADSFKSGGLDVHLISAKWT